MGKVYAAVAAKDLASHMPFTRKRDREAVADIGARHGTLYGVPQLILISRSGERARDLNVTSPTSWYQTFGVSQRNSGPGTPNVDRRYRS